MKALAPIIKPTLQQEIARIAIQKMVARKFFSYCEIQEAAKVMGRVVHPETMDMLRALHCADFSAMSDNVLTFIYEVCNAICE